MPPAQSATLHPQSPSVPWATHGYHAGPDGFDLVQLMGIFWRRRVVVCVAVIVAVALTCLYLFVTPPTYKALAQVRVQADRNPSLSDLAFNNIFGTLRVDSATVLAEIHVLKSRSVALDVIRRLKLAEDPEFNPFGFALNVPAKNTSMMAPASVPESQPVSFKTLNLFRHDIERLAPEMADSRLGILVDHFLNHVDVRPIGGSTILQIFVDSRDAQKAAQIANTLMDSYINLQIDSKMASSQKIIQWLAERLDAIQTTITTLEKDIEHYRLNNNLVAGASIEIANQQIAQVARNANDIDIRLTESETRLAQAEAWMKNPKQSQSLAEILPSPAIAELQKRLGISLQNRSSLEGRYGPKHPLMAGANQEVDEIRAEIQQEARRQIIHLRASVDNLRTQKKSFANYLTDARHTRGQQGLSSVTLAQMERELAASKAIYGSFADTYNKATQQQTLQSPQAQIVSYASIPSAPAFPNAPLLLASALVMGLFIGMIIAVLQDQLSASARSGSMLQKKLGYNCLAMIPRVTSKNTVRGDLIIREPQSPIAEAVRNLRVALRYRMGGSGPAPKIIAVTSSFSGEGKSTLTAWMALQAARSGEKVLLIDGDLRRPTLQKIISGASDRGLESYLGGQARLEDVIIKDPETGLHILFARPTGAQAMELIASSRMKALLESVGKVYDCVLIDTPAVLLASEAKILAQQAGAVVYVARWHKTRMSALESGIRLLNDYGQERIAFALTQVNLKDHARAGYGEVFYGDDAYAAQALP